MSSTFSHIGLLGRAGDAKAEETLSSIRNFLGEREVKISVSDHIGKLLESKRCDLVIVVGGDGSLLGAARELVHHDVPVMGVNLGRLGFLTDVSPSELEARLVELMDGKYVIETRFLLEVDILRGDKVVAHGEALNDVVFNSGAAAQMLEFELYIDESFVYLQRADGLLMSTPTGSTAYSLSAGGPIMHPCLDAIALVPMFPHSLTSRPLVIGGDSRVRIVTQSAEGLRPEAICDGQIKLEVEPGDELQVRKKKQLLKLIHPRGHDFYASCRDKIGWGVPLND